MCCFKTNNVILFLSFFSDFTEQLANLSLSMINERMLMLDDIMYQAGNMTEVFNNDAMNLSGIHNNIGVCWIFLLSTYYMYALWLNTCAVESCCSYQLNLGALNQLIKFYVVQYMYIICRGEFGLQFYPLVFGNFPSYDIEGVDITQKRPNLYSANFESSNLGVVPFLRTCMRLFSCRFACIFNYIIFAVSVNSNVSDNERELKNLLRLTESVQMNISLVFDDINSYQHQVIYMRETYNTCSKV